MSTPFNTIPVFALMTLAALACSSTPNERPETSAAAETAGDTFRCVSDPDRCPRGCLSPVPTCGGLQCDVLCEAADGLETVGCENDRCAVTCKAGRADCNGDVLDGCEIDVRDDGFNCGACAARCAGYGGCAGGTCSAPLAHVLDLDKESPVAIVDGAIYTIKESGAGDTIRRLSFDGGPPAVLATGNRILDVVVDGDDVFFTDSPWAGTGTLRQVSRSGGAVTTLVEARYTMVYGLLVDRDNLYWVAMSIADGSWQLMKQARAGAAAPVRLASGPELLTNLAIVGSEEQIYWLGDGNLSSVPKAGGAVRIVTQLPTDGYSSLILDGALVYASAGNGVYRVDGSGITAPQRIATAGQPDSVVVVGGEVYFTDRLTSRSVLRVPAKGGDVEVIGSQDVPRLFSYEGAVYGRMGTALYRFPK